MELSQHSFLEELIMGSKMDNTWNPLNPNESFSNNWSIANPFDQTQNFPADLHLPPTNPSFLDLISPAPEYSYPSSQFGELQPFLDALTSPEFGSFYESPMPIQEEYAENRETQFLDNGFNVGFEEGLSCYKVESADGENITNMEIHNTNLYGDKKFKAKKPDGQPSKNLMAERRRRKRLNDRLSMLRSIVPKISKMDRTSILGDTIDYMRELLDKIQKLREEGMDDSSNQMNLIGNYLKELKPNEMLVRNPPKFDVERRDQDTRVEVCCTSKPGLLLSTLSTLDALGLDIQQCVISCFNDFSLQASCYEETDHQPLVNPEDVKQALFRNAGYGGRCL